MRVNGFDTKMELIRVRQTPGGLRRTASIAPKATSHGFDGLSRYDTFGPGAPIQFNLTENQC
jgi:hypothetical protein